MRTLSVDISFCSIISFTVVRCRTCCWSESIYWTTANNKIT